MGGVEREKQENETRHNTKVISYCTFVSVGVIHCRWNWNDAVAGIGIWNETLNWKKIQLVCGT